MEMSGAGAAFKSSSAEFVKVSLRSAKSAADDVKDSKAQGSNLGLFLFYAASIGANLLCGSELRSDVLILGWKGCRSTGVARCFDNH
jgi:hypothetical protein